MRQFLGGALEGEGQVLVADALQEGLQVAGMQLGEVLEDEHALADGVRQRRGQGLQHAAFGLAVHQGEQVGEGLGAGGLFLVAHAGGEFLQAGIYFRDEFERGGVAFRDAAGYVEAHVTGEASQHGGRAILRNMGEHRGDELRMLIGQQGAELLAAGAGKELQGNGGLRAAAGAKALDDLGGLLLTEGAGDHGLGIVQTTHAHFLLGFVGGLELGQDGFAHLSADTVHTGEKAGDLLDLFLLETREDGGGVLGAEGDEQRADFFGTGEGAGELGEVH